MTQPIIKQRGETLTARDVNAISRNAALGSNPAGARGLNVGAGSIANIPVPDDWRDCIRCAYAGPTIDVGSVVHVYRMHDTTNATDEGYCRIAARSGFRSIGVAMQGAKNGDVIWIKNRGVIRFIWDRATVPTYYQPYVPGAMYPGKRFGIVEGSPYAQWDDQGPILALDMSLSLDTVVGYGSWSISQPDISRVGLDLGMGIGIITDRPATSLYTAVRDPSNPSVYLYGGDCQVLVIPDSWDVQVYGMGYLAIAPG